jgi:PST family polysaccharide transporter
VTTPLAGASPAEAGEAPGGVGSRARRALVWSFLNVIVSRVGTTLIGIVLARILVPEDYGVYAVALTGLNALLSVNELGVSLAVVRWPGDVRRIAPTVATIAIASSLLLYVVCFLVAGRVSAYMGAPQAGDVLRVLALAVLIDGFTAVSAGMLTREFMQRQRLVVDTVGFVVTGGLSIVLATQGVGAWSLVWGALVGNLINAAMLLKWSPWSFRLGWAPEHVRELLAFGLPLAAASLIVFGMLNADYIVVGRLFGPVQLGFYLLAFNLSTWPVSVFSGPVRRVSLPAFARLAHDRQAVGDAFVRAIVLLMLATLPVCLLLGLFAAPLIELVYGPKWAASAAPLAFLAVLAVGRVAGELAYDYLTALGRPRPNLYIQGIWLAALLPALILGGRWGGITGVAMGHALVVALVVAPAYALVLRTQGVRVRSLLWQSRWIALGLVASAAVGLVALELLDGTVLTVLVGGAAAGLAYLVGVLPMRRWTLAALGRNAN